MSPASPSDRPPSDPPVPGPTPAPGAAPLPEPHTDLPGDEHHPHTPADDREIVHFEGHPLLRGHVGQLLAWWAAGLVLFVTPMLWARFAESWPVWWVTLALWALAALAVAMPVILTRTVRYRISNYRIDYEHGILIRHCDTLELWHVDDIRLRQTLLDRILRVGTITVLSRDQTTPRLPLHGIPNPRPILETIKQRIISVKRQRGVIKMDIG